MTPVMKRFSEVARVVTGKTPSTANELFFGGHIPFVTPGDLDGEAPIVATKTQLTTEGAGEVNRLPKGSVLVSCIGTLGKVGIAGVEVCTNQQINALVFDESLVEPRYGYHFCKTLRPYLEGIAPATTLPIINKSRFSEVEMPLPPLPEQRRIAAILDKADALRAKRREAIAKLDQLLQSVFLEMFGDPLLNPKGFPIRKLSEFYVSPRDGTKCGPFGSALKKEEFVDNGVPVWNMDNISLDGRMVLPFRMWITEDKYSDLGMYSVRDGDIVISRAGTVGKMCVARMNGKPAIISTNLIRLRLNDHLRPLYFVSLMLYCKGRVGRLKTGADGTFTHMNTGVLDSLEFPCPPIELQDRFITITDEVERIKRRCQESLNNIENLFGALSAQVFDIHG
ncbi:restriction endonuclease subunit S [Pseudomonas sp. EA_105y_Pfl2_R69]|uniref:restriction endonuclease subunit S n=1 Tax=Pseudomonas sp. EA_105y_Pfl2_R69 TaxID=3088683 RepID=UPI0030DC584A